jgi:hypothetical protein
MSKRKIVSLPTCQLPLTEGRSVGVGLGTTDDQWYVVASDPLEVVSDAGVFPSEAEAWKWVEANCIRGERFQ